MKILIVTGIYPPDIGGPATHLAQCVPYFRSQGAEVSVVTFGKKTEKYVDAQGVAVSVVARTANIFVRFVQYVYAVHSASRGASVMYVHDMSLAGIAAYLIARARGIPYVLRLGGDFVWEQAFEKGATDLDYHSFQGKEPFPYSMRRRLASRIAMGAKAVIVPSKFLGEIVKKWGVPKKKIHVVPNAIDERALATSESVHPLVAQVMEWRQEGKGVVISSGRFVKWKHFDVLVQAARGISDVRVVIVGSGPEADHISALADENVKVVPSLRRSELSALFREADCFMLLSQGETFSFVSLEAFLSGLPVVFVEESALTEVFGEYKGIGAHFLPDRDHRTIADALRHLSRFSPPTEEAKEALRARYSLNGHLEAIWGIIEAYKRPHGE